MTVASPSRVARRRARRSPEAVDRHLSGRPGRPISPEALERVIEKDRAFFRAFPQRDHRMRPAEQPELDAIVRAGGEVADLWPGYHRVVVVRQIAPGARLRRLCQLPVGRALDAPECVCADLYRYLAGEPDTVIGRLDAESRGTVH